MPLSYAIRRVFRSWRLFVALLVGIALASTFFAGIDIKASATARAALDQDLSRTSVDMSVDLYGLNPTRAPEIRQYVQAIEGVERAEAITRVEGSARIGDSGSAEYVTIVGIENDSRIYDGWLNKPASMSENETYVWENSGIADRITIGDILSVNFSFYIQNRSWPVVLTWDFVVKGLAKLDDKAYSIITGYFSGPLPMNVLWDFLLADWQQTMLKLLQTVHAQDSSSVEQTRLSIWIDRDSLIDPWDMQTSIENTKKLKNQIENQLSVYGIPSVVSNNLEWILLTFTIKSIIIRMVFTLVSLPIFFMAWYMGTTVSDVSFNLRRREIGLLLTKGFSRGQVFTTFLAEAVLLGAIGGLLGIVFGFLLNPLFTQFSTDALFDLRLLNPYTLAFTVIFGVVMAVLSTYSSAKRASQLPTLDALREYLPVEAVKPYRKRLPWIAFLLGAYKIVIYISGINVATVVTSTIFRGGNFFLVLLAIPIVFVDSILNYFGPLLFFWGSTKILIQGSLKFQEITTKVAKSLGDLGALATKNVRRNPARSASIAFLIALIISYSAQVTGQLAYEQDYTIRNIYYQVGADLSVYVPYPREAQNISRDILTNASDAIENTTIEYSIEAYYPGGTHGIIKAVDPQSWLKTAFHEGGWFSGNDVSSAFSTLETEKNTTILELAIARDLDLQVGDYVAVTFGYTPRNLRITGFFGLDLDPQSVIVPTMSTRFWSFVSEDLYKEIENSASVSSTRILLKLKTGVNGTSVAEQIRDLGLNISSVESFAEQWTKSQSDVLTLGWLDAQRLGILFAALAASVGTALVSLVSMKERSREATIMSVRGLSYKQLVLMFLTENLALVLFSTVLGVSVGFVVIYGNLSAANSLQQSIIQRRLVFPLDAAALLASCVALIFASTILPIALVCRRFVTKLERMVRLR